MPTLYLMMGYPGAGKTTTSHVIHELTGATHLWADQIRRERFGTPTYTQDENNNLYIHLNQVTDELLATGQSVIFDTSFNLYKDRQHLRTIAAKHQVDVQLLWICAPKEIARMRATKDSNTQMTRILGNMHVADFERLSTQLEEPHPDEPYTKIDGTKVSKEYIIKKLNLA